MKKFLTLAALAGLGLTMLGCEQPASAPPATPPAAATKDMTSPPTDPAATPAPADAAPAAPAGEEKK
jgi:hypothetical protein